MAKEYIIEKAFRKTISKEDKTPLTFEAHGKVMWPWLVKVEGEDFWFQKTTLENGAVTPGDTLYGLFDEETVTPKNGGEAFTVKKFVKMPRPDGSYDKVQSRDGASSQGSEATTVSPTTGGLGNQVDYIVQMLEELTGRRTVGENIEPAPAQPDVVVEDDEPISLDDLNL